MSSFIEFCSENNSTPFIPDKNYISSLKYQPSVIFLTSNEIFSRIEEKVKEAMDLLSEGFDNSLIILRFFRWSKERIENEYFNDCEKYLEDFGIKIKVNLEKKKKDEIEMEEEICPICPICFENEKLIEIELVCQHRCCLNCWRSYLDFKIKDNIDSTAFWKCPFDECNLILKHSFIFNILPNKINEYVKRLCQEFTNESYSVKWCPFPNCKYCIENIKFDFTEIKCLCLNTFCFLCGGEAHKPCTCSQILKVLDVYNKTTSENKSNLWIKIHTKSCPKCQTPIEKNKGCDHMICIKVNCNYEFCWNCLMNWKTHSFSRCIFQTKNNAYKINEIESWILQERLTKFQKSCKNETNISLNDFSTFKDGGECLVEAARFLKYTFAYCLNTNLEQIDAGLMLYLDWLKESTDKLYKIFDSKQKFGLERITENIFIELRFNLIEQTQAVRKCIELISNYLENE